MLRVPDADINLIQDYGNKMIRLQLAKDTRNHIGSAVTALIPLRAAGGKGHQGSHFQHDRPLQAAAYSEHQKHALALLLSKRTYAGGYKHQRHYHVAVAEKSTDSL